VRVVCVVGARPNFVKAKPVLEALERRGVEVVLIHTGQHYDPLMSDVFFTDLGLRPPDYSLGVGSGSHARQTAAIMVAFEPLLDRLRPDVVLVFGDVNSTIAAALVAAKSGALLGHVEAGLRSRDWRMPEEVNRVATDRLSDYLFAPSRDAAENLGSEGYRQDQIHFVGNVMVDSLLASVERALGRPVLDELGLTEQDYGLVTIHRPENVDYSATLKGLLDVFDQIAADLHLVLPAHPRLLAQLQQIELNKRLQIIEPLGYLDFIALEARAQLVLTDSGGIQEETTILGIPCLTLRESTERPITVTSGTNIVVGRDPRRIVAEVRRAITGDARPRRPELWDGQAGERIAGILVGDANRPPRLRPTDLPSAIRQSL
jgi:UDP-N-acetylglucosamine 2-epimerase (non-hydrolysing)